MVHIVAVCRSQQRTDPKEDIDAGGLRAGGGCPRGGEGGRASRGPTGNMASALAPAPSPRT